MNWYYFTVEEGGIFIDGRTLEDAGENAEALTGCSMIVGVQLPEEYVLPTEEFLRKFLDRAALQKACGSVANMLDGELVELDITEEEFNNMKAE